MNTLVLTVGLSPVPIVLSIRTLNPERAVLVHTDVTEQVADRIAGSFADSSLQVVKVDCATGDDFACTYKVMREELEKLDTPFALDYTGGTSAMVAVASIVHHELHGDVPSARLYQDYTAGTLRSEDGKAYSVDTRTTIAEMAWLNGFRFDNFSASWNAVTQQLTPPDDNEMQGFLDIADSPPEQLTHQLHTFRGQLGRCLAKDSMPPKPGTHPVRLRYPNPPKVSPEKRQQQRKGAIVEWVLDRYVIGGQWDEVALSFNAYDDFGDGPVPVAEFDAVVRRGHRIAVIEMKSRADTAFKRAGVTLAAADAVFGSVAAVRSISALEGYIAEARQEFHDQLQGVIASLGRWRHWEVTSNPDPFDSGQLSLDELPRQIDGLIARTRSPGKFDWDAVRRVENCAAAQPSSELNHGVYSPAGSSIAVLGGSPMAVISATEVSGDNITVVGAEPVTDDFQIWLKYFGRPQKPFAAADLNADTLTRFISDKRLAEGPTTLFITPGRKTAAASMASTFISDGRDDIDLVHLDVRADRIHSWRHGSCLPQYQLDWRKMTNPQLTTLKTPDSRQRWYSRLADSDREAIKAAVSLLPYPKLYSPFPRWPWWTPIFFVANRRVVGLVAPNEHRNIDKPQNLIKEQILAVDQHLASVAGDAGTLLLIQPDGFSESNMRAWHRLLRTTPPPIIATAKYDARGTCALEGWNGTDLATAVRQAL